MDPSVESIFLSEYKKVSIEFLWLHEVKDFFNVDLNLVRRSFIKNAIYFVLVNAADSSFVNFLAHVCPVPSNLQTKMRLLFVECQFDHQENAANEF